MLYLVQKNTFRPQNYEKLITGLKELGYKYEIVLIKVNNSGLFEEDGKNYYYNTEVENIFAFGAVKMAACSCRYQWKPGSLLNKATHDYNSYVTYYKDNLLNYDSKVCDVIDDIEFDPFHGNFIRPTEDSKVFTGQVFNEESWNEFKKHVSYNYSGLHNRTRIQVATVKVIYREIRCWIINGVVITSARYKGVDLGPKEYDAERFAQKMADIHCVAEAFVMDVCLTSDGWKIVEINCINCSGFYGADIKLILFEINEHFDESVEFIEPVETQEI